MGDRFLERGSQHSDLFHRRGGSAVRAELDVGGDVRRVDVDLRLEDRFVDLVEEGIDVALCISAAQDSSLIARRNPAVSGQWGPVINFPLVPVSAALLPNNKVLTFSAYSPTTFDSNS